MGERGAQAKFDLLSDVQEYRVCIPIECAGYERINRKSEIERTTAYCNQETIFADGRVILSTVRSSRFGGSSKHRWEDNKREHEFYFQPRLQNARVLCAKKARMLFFCLATKATATG